MMMYMLAFWLKTLYWRGAQRKSTLIWTMNLFQWRQMGDAHCSCCSIVAISRKHHNKDSNKHQKHQKHHNQDSNKDHNKDSNKDRNKHHNKGINTMFTKIRRHFTFLKNSFNIWGWVQIQLAMYIFPTFLRHIHKLHFLVKPFDLKFCRFRSNCKFAAYWTSIVLLERRKLPNANGEGRGHPIGSEGKSELV